MKKYFFHTVALMFALAIVRCETIIDVDLPEHKPALVLNSFFSTDTTFIVTLHENKDILDNSHEFKTISNATIELYRNNNLVGTFSENNPGHYLLGTYPESGVNYSIKASKAGYETVISNDVIPTTNANPKIEKMEGKSNEYGDQTYHLTYTLNDPLGEDYYEVLLFAYLPKYEYYQDEDTSYQLLNGYYKNQIYYNEIGAELNEFEDTSNPGVFSDELFDGKTYTNTIEIYYYSNDYGNDPESKEAKFSLEVKHLSEAYYRYKVSLQTQQDTDGNPFAEAAPVYNNIDGGYGIFAGYQVEAVPFELTLNKN